MDMMEHHIVYIAKNGCEGNHCAPNCLIAHKLAYGSFRCIDVSTFLLINNNGISIHNFIKAKARRYLEDNFSETDLLEVLI